MAHDVDDVVKVMGYARRTRRADHVPRRGHEPQRPGAGRRRDGRRAPPLARRAGRGRRRAGARAARHAARPRERDARASTAAGSGPIPASTDIATVGGVVANNSGGMRCGVVHDSYQTVRALTFALPSGTVIDTAAPGCGGAVRRARAGAGARPARDPRRAPRRRRAVRAHPPQVRDQEHDGLPAGRVPRRRHAARDLPAPDRRLRGDARVRVRGGVRHGAVRPAHRDRVRAVPRDRRGGRVRASRWCRRARAPPS